MDKKKPAKKIDLFQKKPTTSVSLVIHCHAPKEMFARDMSPEIAAEVEQNGSIPCCGGGFVSQDCAGCRFVKFEEPDEL